MWAMRSTILTLKCLPPGRTADLEILAAVRGEEGSKEPVRKHKLPGSLDMSPATTTGVGQSLYSFSW